MLLLRGVVVVGVVVGGGGVVVVVFVGGARRCEVLNRRYTALDHNQRRSGTCADFRCGGDGGGA